MPGCRPTLRGRFDKRVYDGAKSQRDQQRPRPVDGALRLGVAAFRYVAQRQHQGCNGERNIDEERGAPRPVIDQPTAEHRTERHGDGRCGGPRSDGLAALALLERCADDRQTPRHQQRAANALDRTGHDQLANTPGKSAPDRRCRKQRNTPGEHAATTEAVTRSATDEEQCGQEQGVGLDDPLNVGEARGKLALQRRERHIHHRPVDKYHARRKDGCGQHPSRRGGCAGQRTRRRADGRCIRRCPGERSHRPPGSGDEATDRTRFMTYGAGPPESPSARRPGIRLRSATPAPLREWRRRGASRGRSAQGPSRCARRTRPHR